MNVFRILILILVFDLERILFNCAKVVRKISILIWKIDVQIKVSYDTISFGEIMLRILLDI